MPGFIFNPGRIGIVSDGTLTYEAVDQITKAGRSEHAIGIGRPIIGTTAEAVQLLMADEETGGIIMIGEIGGDLEVGARWIKKAPSRWSASSQA